MLKWGKRYAKLCAWVEDNIEETFAFYRRPRQHHTNLKSDRIPTCVRRSSRSERGWKLGKSTES
ncbi:MAG: transposase [Acidobacteriaceae bacterium]|nr:transposase [Acidobacteriaceae bacterium]